MAERIRISGRGPTRANPLEAAKTEAAALDVRLHTFFHTCPLSVSVPWVSTGLHIHPLSANHLSATPEADVCCPRNAQAESGAESDLPFTCTVMLLGISGCGKSSVVNSLLGRQACATDAFGPSTEKVQRG